GGDAIKPWLLRRELPYEESVPSVILAKTAEVISQLLLLVVAVVVAFQSDVVDPALRKAMLGFLVVEVIAVGGVVAVQTTGIVERCGRVLAWAGLEIGLHHAQRLDGALRGFYRDDWKRFMVAVGVYLVGWLVGIVETWLTLVSLALPGSIVLAMVLE